MIVQCPQCHAKYNLDENWFGDRPSLLLRCTKCKTTYPVEAPTGKVPVDPTVTPPVLSDATRVSSSDAKPWLPETQVVSLVVTQGPLKGKIFPVSKPTVLLGRRETDIVLEDTDVSRKHCALEVRGTTALLVDLGSTNGTFVDNERIGTPNVHKLGRYEILEELGRGAMGTVYRARDPKIDRIVAIKTVTVLGGDADGGEYRKRFFREAQAAGRLSHPGIVTIHDVGEEESTQTPYIVMEYIAGPMLETFLSGSAQERQAVDTTLELMKQIAEALDYAHSQGIVHRDVKPANIIVTPEGRAKITDFGIAKLVLTQFTMPGETLGTPSYMSPEQATGDPVDGRSDLFSLGIILYRMLAGEKPFTGDTPTAVTFKIAYKDPVPATQVNPSLAPS